MLPGDPAPPFTAPTPSTAAFSFHTVAGRYVLLAFLPMEAAAAQAALKAIVDHRQLFDDDKLCVFIVLRDREAIPQAKDEPPGLRWFLDAEGAVSRLYGMLDADGTARPSWLLLDPTLRVLANAPMSDTLTLMKILGALPPVDDHADTRMHAPVLIVPRVFEPDFCKHLIAVYQANGGAPSGFMREVDGRTKLMRDPTHKRRSDVMIEDEPLRDAARARLLRRLAPEILKTFQFQPTRIERYIVSQYDSAELGFFRPHRDNTTKGTAHRKFAVTLNLNAEDYDGGELRFPEYGSATYRAPTGGAVVFSCSLLHEATPVTRGVRYAFLPFLYDEAGAAVREANLEYLDDEVAGALTGKRAAE
ncbi:MAG: hypothetical protein JWP35_126 [Caulobacter sp.]|nr:hypothetical protein [Caulobacter sp.]